MHPRVFRLLNSIQGWDIWPRNFRVRILRLMGVTISKDAIINPHVTFLVGRISIGSRVFINRDVLIDGAACVSIGDLVHLAPRAMIITESHMVGPPTRRAGEITAAPVEICAGAWIGAGAIILPGTKVGSGCVVAAGAVLTKDAEKDGLYAGMPASRRRDLM